MKKGITLWSSHSSSAGIYLEKKKKKNMFEESLHDNVDQGSIHNVQEMKNLPMY